MLSTLEKLDIIDKKIDHLGLRCIDIRYAQPVVNLFIDFPSTTDTSSQENVSIEDCVRATKVLREWEVLDEWYGDSFELSVCSPGIERPVKRTRDFKNFVGNYFKIKLNQKLNGQKNFQGELLEVCEEDKDNTKIQIKFEENVSMIPIQEILYADCHLMKKGRC